MTRTEALATLASLLTAVTPLRGIELTQPAGVLHGYPAMRELDGKLLGRGEFTQEVQGESLRIEIKYELTDGREIIERTSFRQHPEVTQKEWSWQEIQGKTVLR